MLDGYKNKVYGHDGEYPWSMTVKKVIIENGKVVLATGELPEETLIDYSETNNANINITTIKTDSKTNIKLEASSDIIPDNTIIDVIEITSGETFDKIKNFFPKIESFKAFDITLKANDTNIQPNGKVRISIPIPVGFNVSRLIVYRLEEDGTKTEYQVTVTNEYATFETDHFSTYVLGETVANDDKSIQKQEENKEVNDTKLPQTGEETNTFAKWLTVFIILGIIWLGSMIFIDHEKKKMTNK